MGEGREMGDREKRYEPITNRKLSLERKPSRTMRTDQV
jgi:hypothetical protein